MSDPTSINELQYHAKQLTDIQQNITILLHTITDHLAIQGIICQSQNNIDYECFKTLISKNNSPIIWEPIMVNEQADREPKQKNLTRVYDRHEEFETCGFYIHCLYRGDSKDIENIKLYQCQAKTDFGIIILTFCDKCLINKTPTEKLTTINLWQTEFTGSRIVGALKEYSNGRVNLNTKQFLDTL